MAFEFLTPVHESVLENLESLNEQTLGHQMRIHNLANGVPDLKGVKLAILGICENRNTISSLDESVNFNAVRKSFYALYPGNWGLQLADLGDIMPGDQVEDTYFAVKTIVSALLRKAIIPMIIGGGQDLAYWQYRAYDNFDQMVNLVNVDSRFDLGDASEVLDSQSFVGKIVIDQPYNLFNYSNLGYQTYFNAQAAIDLMNKLYFDAYRLGEISSDISITEPVLRDADMVCIDMGAINGRYLSYNESNSPNGFDGKEICSIARYAGISDKVTSFGVFEIKSSVGDSLSATLIAQMFWYFVEGVNYRSKELVIRNQPGVLYYKVPIEDEVLSFYKSEKTERWWIEIPFISGNNNKLKRHTLLPCNYKDYENACNQQIPERWFKARRKNEV